MNESSNYNKFISNKRGFALAVLDSWIEENLNYDFPFNLIEAYNYLCSCDLPDDRLCDQIIDIYNQITRSNSSSSGENDNLGKGSPTDVYTRYMVIYNTDIKLSSPYKIEDSPVYIARKKRALQTVKELIEDAKKMDNQDNIKFWERIEVCIDVLDIPSYTDTVSDMMTHYAREKFGTKREEKAVLERIKTESFKTGSYLEYRKALSENYKNRSITEIELCRYMSELRALLTNLQSRGDNDFNHEIEALFKPGAYNYVYDDLDFQIIYGVDSIEYIYEDELFRRTIRKLRLDLPISFPMNLEDDEERKSEAFKRYVGYTAAAADDE